MKRLSLFCTVTVLLNCAISTDLGLVEVAQDGGLLHYTPTSSESHWLLPSFPNGTELLLGPGTVLVERGEHDSISITFVGGSPFSFESLDISALVRCELGCDARLEAMAFDGRCYIVPPPACVRLIPKFRRLTLCLRTGEFVTDASIGSPFVDVEDAVDAGRLLEKEPYDVTFDC